MRVGATSGEHAGAHAGTTPSYVEAMVASQIVRQLTTSWPQMAGIVLFGLAAVPGDEAHTWLFKAKKVSQRRYIAGVARLYMSLAPAGLRRRRCSALAPTRLSVAERVYWRDIK